MKDQAAELATPMAVHRMDLIGSPHNMPEIYMAADRVTARVIGERDNWTCQISGKRFQDGWLVDIAHDNHDKKDLKYNHPDNLRVLSLGDHLLIHLDMYQEDPSAFNTEAMIRICNRAWKNGLRTWQHYGRKPADRAYDMQRILDMMKSRDIEPNMILRGM